MSFLLKKACLSPSLWSYTVITVGLSPILLADIVIGIFMIAIPICLIILSRRTGIPRGEWFALSFVVLIFCSFTLALSEAFIYPIVVYGIAAFMAAFSFEKRNFIKDKAALTSSHNENDSFIVGEFPPALSPDRKNLSMCFDHNRKYLGSAVPIADYGSHFTFYGKGMNCCSMYDAGVEWKFPFLYPHRTYRLDEGNHNILTIKRINLRKIKIEFPNETGFIIPLYKRKQDIPQQDGSNYHISLYDEGVLIKGGRGANEQMATAISCLSYFLWLNIFGPSRRND